MQVLIRLIGERVRKHDRNRFSENNRYVSRFNSRNPVVIFVSYQMEYDSRLIRNLMLAFLLAFICFVVQILVCNLLIRKKGNGDYQIERLCAVYSNCGFIGIPLINGLFGREGVFYLTGYLTVFYLFLWTHGVILMTGKADRRTTIKNLCSPAIMGAALGQTSLRSCVGSLRIYYVSAVRLMLIPFCLIFLFQFLPFSPILILTTLIAAACPVGACCTMFALKYGKDGTYASQIFTVSTLFCIVTIPLLVAAAGAFHIG